MQAFIDDLATVVLVVDAWWVNENAKESRDDKKRPENVPWSSLAASGVEHVTEDADNGSHDSVSKLAGEHSTCSDCLIDSDDIDEVVSQVDEPHACAKIIIEVTH